MREDDAKACGGAAISDHVQDRPECGRLLERASCVAIGSIKELRKQVGPNCDSVVGERHAIADERKQDAHVTDEVGHIKIDGNHWVARRGRPSGERTPGE